MSDVRDKDTEEDKVFNMMKEAMEEQAKQKYQQRVDPCEWEKSKLGIAAWLVKKARKIELVEDLDKNTSSKDIGDDGNGVCSRKHPIVKHCEKVWEQNL